MTMQTTFIVRNITDPALRKVTDAPPLDAYNKLLKWAQGDLRHCVSVQHGRGSFGERVTWNGLIKAGATLSFKVEPRRGYRLVTFSAQAA